MKKINIGLKKSKEKIKLFDFSEGVAADLPKNLPNIVLIGNREAHIENIKSITEYSETVVKINLGSSSITFIGERLFISSLNENEITVCGIINGVEFD